MRKNVGVGHVRACMRAPIEAHETNWAFWSAGTRSLLVRPIGHGENPRDSPMWIANRGDVPDRRLITRGSRAHSHLLFSRATAQTSGTFNSKNLKETNKKEKIVRSLRATIPFSSGRFRFVMNPFIN